MRFIFCLKSLALLLEPLAASPQKAQPLDTTWDIKLKHTRGAGCAPKHIPLSSQEPTERLEKGGGLRAHADRNTNLLTEQLELATLA